MAMRIAPMEAGERDQIITLQQRPATETVDTEGAPVDGPWTTLVASMPASKADVIGGEAFKADQLSAKVTTRFEINYRPDMDPDLIDVPKLRRVLHRGRQYDVVMASLIGRREGVELLTLASTRVT